MAGNWLKSALVLAVLITTSGFVGSGPPPVNSFSFEPSSSGVNLGNNGASSNNLSAAFVGASGSNQCLIVILNAGDNPSNYTVAGGGSLVYNGTQMTLIGPTTFFGWGNSGWILANPSSGSNNLVATSGGGSVFIAFPAVLEYAGCAQSGQPANWTQSLDGTVEDTYTTTYAPSNPGDLVIGFGSGDGGTVPAIAPPFALRSPAVSAGYVAGDTTAFSLVSVSTTIHNAGDAPGQYILELKPSSGVTPP